MTTTETREKPVGGDRSTMKGDAMIRATLDGRKTQFRVPVRPQPQHQLYIRTNRAGNEVWHERFGELMEDGTPRFGLMENIRCPYEVGMHLWVRETYLPWRDKNGPCKVAAYRADGYQLEDGEQWVPSIHMPRWASRITLEVTGVRVERVAEISEADVESEGVDLSLARNEKHAFAMGGSAMLMPDRARRIFSKLWNSLHGPDAFERNDWVWVVDFKRTD